MLYSGRLLLTQLSHVATCVVIKYNVLLETRIHALSLDFQLDLFRKHFHAGPRNKYYSPPKFRQQIDSATFRHTAEAIFRSDRGGVIPNIPRVKS